MKDNHYLGFISLIFAACASLGMGSKPISSIDEHNPYVLNVEQQTLQAHLPQNDRNLASCNAIMLASGQKQYQCVVHFIPDYQALLNQMTTLLDQLKACQAAH
jgi:hypothetical protein